MPFCFRSQHWNLQPWSVFTAAQQRRTVSGNSSTVFWFFHPILEKWYVNLSFNKRAWYSGDISNTAGSERSCRFIFRAARVQWRVQSGFPHLDSSPSRCPCLSCSSRFSWSTPQSSLPEFLVRYSGRSPLSLFRLPLTTNTTYSVLSESRLWLPLSFGDCSPLDGCIAGMSIVFLSFFGFFRNLFGVTSWLTVHLEWVTLRPAFCTHRRSTRNAPPFSLYYSLYWTTLGFYILTHFP